MNDHLAAIFLAGGPRNVTQPLEPIYKLDSAVMSELQTLRQFADGCGDSVGQSLDGQKKLVLLRLHARRPHLFLAKTEKSADLVAEFRQGTILFQRQVLHQLYRNTILLDPPLRVSRRSGVQRLAVKLHRGANG